MPLQLSAGEKLIRSWNYAGDDTSFGRNDDVLIVTDKRLIATSSSPDTLRRTEIPLNSIKSISSYYSSKRSLHSDPKAGLIVLGIIFLILSIALMLMSTNNNIILLYVGIVLAVIGIILIIAGATKKSTVLTSSTFSLRITTYGTEGTPLSIGKKAGDTQLDTVVINTVTINEKVIMDIIDTLGAIALNKEPPLPSTTDTKKSPFIDNAVLSPTQPPEKAPQETKN